MENENDLIANRKQKLKELQEKKVNPFAYSFKNKNISIEILDKFKNIKKGEKAKQKVSIAGRIMTLRNMGKASFGHIQDKDGQIQFYIREDEIGQDNYEIFERMDMGDFIGIEGVVFKTKVGEVSIWVEKFEILAKALRPMPEKWHGLKDKETRYRQRYLDLISNRSVKEVFIVRSKIISAMREFLDKQGFIEVEIPYLQEIYGGANARPFKTHIYAWNMDLFLSISPEIYLKKLIIGGMDRVYTIGKCFRNEGVDRTHNPEFTTMECYWSYVDYEDMMKLTEEMYTFIAKKVLGKTNILYEGKRIDLKAPWKRITMIDAIKKYADIDVNKLDDKGLKNILRNYNIEYRGDFNRGLAIELIFEYLVEDKLIQPTFVTDYPRETCPLCKLKRGNNKLIERFEPFINGWEIGNAYSELNDPVIQKELLQKQVEAGRGGDAEAHPMDEDFIKAMEYGMPPTGGLGLSIDRMVMLFTNSTSIRDVILFPIMKPEE